jgi:hypothetical protein
MSTDLMAKCRYPSLTRLGLKKTQAEKDAIHREKYFTMLPSQPMSKRGVISSLKLGITQVVAFSKNKSVQEMGSQGQKTHDQLDVSYEQVFE